MTWYNQMLLVNIAWVYEESGGGGRSLPLQVCPLHVSAPPPPIIHPAITFWVQVHVYVNKQQPYSPRYSEN